MRERAQEHSWGERGDICTVPLDVQQEAQQDGARDRGEEVTAAGRSQGRGRASSRDHAVSLLSRRSLVQRRPPALPTARGGRRFPLRGGKWSDFPCRGLSPSPGHAAWPAMPSHASWSLSIVAHREVQHVAPEPSLQVPPCELSVIPPTPVALLGVGVTVAPPQQETKF